MTVEHICEVCFHSADQHEEDCDCGERRWPPLCCQGCGCRSYEEAHTREETVIVAINEFRGKYRFLSNFYPTPSLELDGVYWSTAEHAYQAAKTNDDRWKDSIRRADTPKEAKQLGKRAPKRPDWESIKVDEMERIVLQKFRTDIILRIRLIGTGEAELVEGNY